MSMNTSNYHEEMITSYTHKLADLQDNQQVKSGKIFLVPDAMEDSDYSSDRSPNSSVEPSPKSSSVGLEQVKRRRPAVVQAKTTSMGYGASSGSLAQPVAQVEGGRPVDLRQLGHSPADMMELNMRLKKVMRANRDSGVMPDLDVVSEQFREMEEEYVEKSGEIERLEFEADLLEKENARLTVKKQEQDRKLQEKEQRLVELMKELDDHQQAEKNLREELQNFDKELQQLQMAEQADKDELSMMEEKVVETQATIQIIKRMIQMEENGIRAKVTRQDGIKVVDSDGSSDDVVIEEEWTDPLDAEMKSFKRSLDKATKRYINECLEVGRSIHPSTLIADNLRSLETENQRINRLQTELRQQTQELATLTETKLRLSQQKNQLEDSIEIMTRLNEGLEHASAADQLIMNEEVEEFLLKCGIEELTYDSNDLQRFHDLAASGLREAEALKSGPYSPFF